MLEKVISGGQTGADLAAWRAAKRFGIPIGGWMPAGFLTEGGPRPEFAGLYGAAEHESAAYPPRTRANVRAADALVVFDTAPGWSLGGMSRGTRLAVGEATRAGIPAVIPVVRIGEPITPGHPVSLAAWLTEHGVRTLCVGGNRESKAPGIGAWVECYLCAVFKELGFKEGMPVDGH